MHTAMHSHLHPHTQPHPRPTPARHRYGPNGEGVSVVPDTVTRRVLVPRGEAAAAADADADNAAGSAVDWSAAAEVPPPPGFDELGQFANDLAFAPSMLEQALYRTITILYN